MISCMSNGKDMIILLIVGQISIILNHIVHIIEVDLPNCTENSDVKNNKF